MHVQTMMWRLIAAPSRLAGLLVLLAVALTLPGPAAAVLTSQEATALQRPFAAARSLSSGVSGALLPAIKEVEACRSPEDLVFTTDDVLRRVDELGDLLAPLLGPDRG